MNSTQKAPANFWKRMSKTLLFWVIIAIIAGAILGQFLPSWAVVPFATFNDIFGKYLNFVVPLIILGLVTPAIFELGRTGGKWLLVTVIIAYGSTMAAGFGTWGLLPSFSHGCFRGRKFQTWLLRKMRLLPLWIRVLQCRRCLG
ncbi:cation:dicarboxylase symporter family transporter [Arcanobacterium hippocoleae]